MIVGQTERAKIIGRTERAKHDLVDKIRTRLCGNCGSKKKMFFGNEDYNPTWFCPACEKEE